MLAAWIACITFATTALFVGTASYTQTVAAYGQISTRKGITRIKAHQQGVITEINVREGDQVSVGTVLFTTSSDRPAQDSRTLRDVVTRELNQRLETAVTEIAAKRSLWKAGITEIKTKIEWINSDIERQKLEIRELRQATKLAETMEERAQLAFSRHLISEEQLNARSLELVDRNAKLILANRDIEKS
ncbi:biotin/lipoyl-binding protein [Luteibacter sp. E-22]|uniref:biotin/lipoyl-binding protein n=1 Tax=Luteibacter sp. E-22 TaxID=3404050 RepID=UPI003CE74922